MYFYLLLAIPPLIAGLAAQAWVRRTFTEASKVPAVSGMTGAEVSRRMLDAGGLTDVSVESISGELSDHYDPRTQTMRLSPPVGGSSSVAAVAVAAHETGHAFQDANHEAGFRFRGALVPATGFASQAWFPIFLIGLIMGRPTWRCSASRCSRRSCSSSSRPCRSSSAPAARRWRCSRTRA
jgi:Zn-dependent membrane protease YugP